ncbi:MAG TPA: AAA family ATPase [Chlamydiales bacterium]|jgi:predicted AAA+ superfamily ATPase|nr:AAA family ATPase [Chlamydiales bacterium]
MEKCRVNVKKGWKNEIVDQKKWLLKRFFTPPKQSFFLFGPRGTGKSTWMRTLFPEALYINLLLSALREKFRAYPDELMKEVATLPKPATIIIDEVQKVPDLLAVVHALIEEKQGLQFILTGSSARKLRQGGADLLGGRALIKQLDPFMATELGEQFVLEKALKIGMLPLVWEAEEPEEVLSTYASVYVDEEVQAEALVRNIGQFSRFLHVMSFSHGQILNGTNVARECSVKRHTVDNFIGILEDLLLSVRVPVFTHRAQRELTQHPKFYLFDVGIFRALRKMGPGDTDSEIEGPALEGLVFQHLRAWIHATKGRHDLYFWRTKAGLEVDFVVYGELGFWAIEVKNSKNLSPDDVRGLNHFVQDYPTAKPLLLYRGTSCLEYKGVLCMPVDLFLKQLTPNTPF